MRFKAPGIGLLLSPGIGSSGDGWTDQQLMAVIESYTDRLIPVIYDGIDKTMTPNLLLIPANINIPNIDEIEFALINFFNI